MEFISNAWAIIEPYFMKLVEFVINTGIGTTIALMVVQKWQKKHSDQNLAETVSNGVANKIIGKDIKVSLESANKAQIDALKGDLMSIFLSQQDKILKQSELLIAIGAIVSKFKSATPEEREVLVKALNELEKSEEKPLTEIKEEEPVIVTIGEVEKDEGLF